MWFKFTKAIKVQSNQSISIPIVLTWYRHQTMVRQRFGTRKKGNLNTRFKLIPTTRSSVEKEITSSVEVLRKQLTFGSADSMTLWRRRSCQAKQQLATRTTGRKSSLTLNPPAAKSTRDPSPKDSFRNPNYVWQNSKIQTGSLKMLCTTTRTIIFNWWTHRLRKNKWITRPK